MRSIEMTRLVNDSLPQELQLVLESNPTLIIAQDEHGRTLLHHVAVLETTDKLLFNSSERVIEKLNILLNAPGVDFSIKDLMGNTAVHIAAMSSSKWKSCIHIFPAFIKKAAEHEFDFMTPSSSVESFKTLRSRIITPYHSILTCEKTVLQITILSPVFDNEIHKNLRHEKVLTVLKNVPNPGLNVLSESGRGGSVLYDAIRFFHLDLAKILLDAGSNPGVYGRKECDPIAELNKLLNEYIEKLEVNESQIRRAYASVPLFKEHFFRDAEGEGIEDYKRESSFLRETIGKVKELKQHPRIACYAEIRKNARILAQGVRGGSIFSTLPTELLIKIAGHTGTPGFHSTGDAEEIARQHLGKPLL